MLFGFETIGCHERTHCFYGFEGVDVKFFAQFSFQFFGGRIPVPEWVFTEVIGDSFYYLFVELTEGGASFGQDVAIIVHRMFVGAVVFGIGVSVNAVVFHSEPEVASIFDNNFHL